MVCYGIFWSGQFNSFRSNVAKQVARFLLPVFPYLKTRSFNHKNYFTSLFFFELIYLVISFQEFRFCVLESNPEGLDQLQGMLQIDYSCDLGFGCFDCLLFGNLNAHGG